MARDQERRYLHTHIQTPDRRHNLVNSGGCFELPKHSFPGIYTTSAFSSVSSGVPQSRAMHPNTVSSAGGDEGSGDRLHSAVWVPVAGWLGRTERRALVNPCPFRDRCSHMKAASCWQRHPAGSLGAWLAHNCQVVWEVGAPKYSASSQLTYHLGSCSDSSRGSRETGIHAVPEGRGSA